MNFPPSLKKSVPAIIVGVIVWIPIAVYAHTLDPSIALGSQVQGPMVDYKSQHVTLQVVEGYTSESALMALVQETETKLAQLKHFLEPPTELDGPVTLLIMQGPGVSQVVGGRLILLYLIKQGRRPIAHELTHVLMGNGANRFLTEGLAIYAQDRLGDFDFPDFWAPAKVALIGEIRLGSFIDPFALEPQSLPFYPGQPTRRTAYLEAGSFTEFLVDRYGYASFEKVYYSGDFVSTYTVPFRDLQMKWLDTLWDESLLLSLIHLTIGLFCIVLISMSLGRKSWKWVPIIVAAPVALAVFNLYVSLHFLSYAAIGMQALVVLSLGAGRYIPTRWARLMIWVGGLSIVAYSEIPAVLNVSSIVFGM